MRSILTSFAGAPEWILKDVSSDNNEDRSLLMKLHLRHAVWALALAFTMAVLVTPMIVAAQSEQGLEHGRGHDKSDQGKDRDDNNANSSSYQQGWNHGQEDRANNRARGYHVRFDNNRDRRAYESGYDQ